jgi:hypothetical protein
LNARDDASTQPQLLAADAPMGRFLALVGAGIIPHNPVRNMSRRGDRTFSRFELRFDHKRNVM